LLPGEEEGDDPPVITPPERLLEEEEPEAFGPRPTRAAGEETDAEEGDEDGERLAAGAPAPGEELDLVRVYLKHVGKRKLLKAKEEQEIGQRIETARGRLQASLGMMPCALKALISLADDVRKGKAPAAELILLPDGGELEKSNIAPTLAAFARI